MAKEGKGKDRIFGTEFRRQFSDGMQYDPTSPNEISMKRNAIKSHDKFVVGQKLCIFCNSKKPTKGSSKRGTKFICADCKVKP